MVRAIKRISQWFALCGWLIFLYLLPSAPALAQEEYRYISDVLFVPLRSGQGNQYRIVNAGLKSSTRLVFLEDGETGEWTRVRTEDGIEGWIRSQYLLNEETSYLKLNRALSELAQVKQSNARLSQENTTLKANNSDLNSLATNSNAAKEKYAQELDKIKSLSAGAIELEQRYTQLLEKHQLLQTKNDVLTAENENLRGNQNINYMLIGAGLLILGMILAFVLPTLKPKKRYSEWR